MKKIILLILLVLLLTGCKATYNISFDKNINESIKIYTSNTNIETANKETVNKVSEELYNFEYGYEYYKKEKYYEGNNTGYNYTNKFDYEDYNMYTELQKCYDDFNYSNDDNTVSLSTSEQFTCFDYYPEIEEVTINMTSQYNITSSNADKVDGNTYTWIINKDNYQNKPLEIKINKKQEYKEKKITSKMIITFGIFLILVLYLLLSIKKNKKGNHQ